MITGVMRDDFARGEAGEGADTALARFILALRSRGIVNPRLTNAFESVPRALFMPNVRPGLLYGQVHLPLPCGEEALEAAELARVLLLLDVEPGHRIAEIGSGSGFVSALLARLGTQVLALERYRTLIAGSELALHRLGLTTVTLRQADGLKRGALDRPVERILLHGAVEHAPQHLFEALVPGGQALGYRQRHEGARLTLWKKEPSGFLSEVDFGMARIGRLLEGLPIAL